MIPLQPNIHCQLTVCKSLGLDYGTTRLVDYQEKKAWLTKIFCKAKFTAGPNYSRDPALPSSFDTKFTIVVLTPTNIPQRGIEGKDIVYEAKVEDIEMKSSLQEKDDRLYKAMKKVVLEALGYNVHYNPCKLPSVGFNITFTSKI